VVTFKRLLLWFALGVGLITYAIIAGRISDKERMILIGMIFLLGIFLTGTGGGRKVKRVRRRSEVVDEEEDSTESIPVPVQSEEDASTRRNEKLSRSRGSVETIADDDDESESDEEVSVSLAEETVSVGVIEENVHVAEEYVAEVDAESMEEADIEGFIEERRDHHSLIRRRIEARRREQLADIRADAAKIYQSADQSEDLVSLLGKENHGLTVIEESNTLPQGSPIGAVYTRIDSERVLKILVPLDQGFVAGKEPLPELPPLPDLGDLPLPPPPALGDLPLPPLPSVSKLDALRDEISNDD
jgi:hypothetical protein